MGFRPPEDELCRHDEESAADMVNGQPYILGKIKMAANAYLKGDVKGLMGCLYDFIAYRGKYTPQVFVLLGYGFEELGYAARARLAFERALHFDPHCIEAILALGTLEHCASGFRASLPWFAVAWKLDQRNSVALNRLSEYYLQKGEFKKARHLADKAFHYSTSDKQKMISAYNLAKSLHGKADIDSAYDWYCQAASLADMNFINPNFGLAQLHVHFNDMTRAIEALKKLVIVYPKDINVLKILGKLLVLGKQPKEATEVLKRAIACEPSAPDIEMRLELAQLLENADDQRSIALYNEACELLQAQNKPIALEVFNNLGALHFKRGEYDTSLGYFQKAAESFSQATSGSPRRLDTIEYNLGRCYEQLRSYDKAGKLYRGILARNPKYFDCHLRLGAIAFSCKRVAEAEVHIKKAMTIDRNNVSALVMAANMKMAQGDIREAIKQFGKIVDLCEGDSYTMTATANAWRELMLRNDHDPENRNRCLHRAISAYEAALRINPKNVYAANGLGCILGYLNEMEKARDVFERIREGSVKPKDLWQNLGYVYVELGLPSRAAAFFGLAQREARTLQ
uniref:TPR_REGION domain-containing protein n=1 Tax=Steinernema glaseri TaxID=37863 RepID=A0A1I7ZHI1_9BILA